MRVARKPGATVQFSIALVNVRAPPGVVRVNESSFTLVRPGPNTAALIVSQSITGPQEIELDWILETHKNNTFVSSGVAKLFMYVSEYEF